MFTQSTPNRKIFALNHLQVITVSGEDRAVFLQGQLTCDIDSLQDKQTTLAAFCNAKGRVISTLLVVRTPDTFVLLLPAGLLDTVLKKLQIYVLRAKVQLSGDNQGLRLYALECPSSTPAEWIAALPDNAEALIMALPWTSAFCLAVSRQQGLVDAATGSLEEWRYQEISAGIPWFESDQTELYTPQMLNIDRLGGVSFSKGCYTGQEIIARTHFLGKAKRHVFMGECPVGQQAPEAGLNVIDTDSQQITGKVLNVATWLDKSRLLLILPESEQERPHLVLDDAAHTAIKIVDLNL